MIEQLQTIPFIDLQAQRAQISAKIDNAIQGVLQHGKFIMGPEVGELESRLAEFTNSNHCISVSNGTDALVISLLAMGVGPGDAVITTPFTFFATVESIMAVGATPIFADIDLATFNIDAAQVEHHIKALKTESHLNLKGIIPVDLFGQCADYESLGRLAEQHGLFVLQDAAQAFGAERYQKVAPCHGHVGTTSFFPAKPLGCYGDGGAIFTDDGQLAEIIRSIRVHGKGKDKYDNVRLGQNARLDTIQAAILLQKLSIYDDELNRRQNAADHYERMLHDQLKSFDRPYLTTPALPENSKSAWAQYTILLDENLEDHRDSISTTLKSVGIPTVVYYRTPSHLLGACKDLGYQAGDFPNSEAAANRVLSLPFHPYLEPETQHYIVSELIKCIKNVKSN